MLSRSFFIPPLGSQRKADYVCCSIDRSQVFFADIFAWNECIAAHLLVSLWYVRPMSSDSERRQSCCCLRSSTVHRVKRDGESTCLLYTTSVVVLGKSRLCSREGGWVALNIVALQQHPPARLLNDAVLLVASSSQRVFSIHHHFLSECGCRRATRVSKRHGRQQKHHSRRHVRFTLIINPSRAIVSSAPLVFSDVFALVSANIQPSRHSSDHHRPNLIDRTTSCTYQ